MSSTSLSVMSGSGRGIQEHGQFLTFLSDADRSGRVPQGHGLHARSASPPIGRRRTNSYYSKQPYHGSAADQSWPTPSQPCFSLACRFRQRAARDLWAGCSGRARPARKPAEQAWISPRRTPRSRFFTVSNLPYTEDDAFDDGLRRPHRAGLPLSSDFPRFMQKTDRFFRVPKLFPYAPRSGRRSQSSLTFSPGRGAGPSVHSFLLQTRSVSWAQLGLVRD